MHMQTCRKVEKLKYWSCVGVDSFTSSNNTAYVYMRDQSCFNFQLFSMHHFCTVNYRIATLKFSQVGLQESMDEKEPMPLL